MRFWRSYWVWVVLGLAIIPMMIIVPAIAITGYTTSSFFPCEACHGTGKAAHVLKPEIVTEEKQCVEHEEYMRVKHSELLNEWRNSVVREGKRVYVASDGKEYDMSLSTCLSCHSNKVKFCDQCHSYVRAKPDCWNCHVPAKR